MLKCPENQIQTFSKIFLDRVYLGATAEVVTAVGDDWGRPVGGSFGGKDTSVAVDNVGVIAAVVATGGVGRTSLPNGDGLYSGGAVLTTGGRDVNTDGSGGDVCVVGGGLA
jgi:hypothetical protein